MRGMFKRWLRRRLDIHTTSPETSLEDVDREIGALVRKGRLVTLRTHVPANREAFQRWYADHDDARDVVIAARGAADVFEAHAWVEGDPDPLAGQFRELLRLGAPTT